MSEACGKEQSYVEQDVGRHLCHVLQVKGYETEDHDLEVYSQKQIQEVEEYKKIFIDDQDEAEEYKEEIYKKTFIEDQGEAEEYKELKRATMVEKKIIKATKDVDLEIQDIKVKLKGLSSVQYRVQSTKID